MTDNLHNHQPTDDSSADPERDADLTESADLALLALLDFRRKWAKLPPLVRASIAGHLAEQTNSLVNNHTRAHDVATGLGMWRRARVNTAFVHAADVLRTLFIALANEGDDEAIRRGASDLVVQKLDGVAIVTEDGGL